MKPEHRGRFQQWVTILLLIQIAFSFAFCMGDVELPLGGSTELHLTVPDDGGPLHSCNEDCGSCVCCTPLLVAAVTTFELSPVITGKSEANHASPISKCLPPLKYPPRV